MRFFTVPANARLPSGCRTSGRSKRKALFARNASSACVLARFSTALRCGKRPKRMITARWRWKISWKALSGSSGARSSIARPHSSMQRCWSSSASEWVSARQRKTRSIGAQARAHPDAQPAPDQRQAARVAGVHLRGLAVHVAAELVEHDHQRHQQARMLDVQRPVVVVTPGREGDVRAELVPDLLVGLLDLAEPQVEALLDARAEHVVEHPLGLVDLRGRDLEVLDLQQHAQLALQALHLRRGERMLLVEARQDHMQPLLDAVARSGIDLAEALVGLPQPADERPRQLNRPLRIDLGGGDERLVARSRSTRRRSPP